MDPYDSAFAGPGGISNHPGLTIRDYIAIEAMKSLISNQNDYKIPEITDERLDNVYLEIRRGQISAQAYRFADALIAEGNKK